MGYTNRQLIDAALEEIGLDGVEFDITPSEYQRCLRRLDAMLAGWIARGIDIDYVVSATPESIDIDAESNLDNDAWEAVYLNLAVAIAPSFGKNVMTDTRANAKRALTNLRTSTAVIKQRPFPSTLPKGSGNKTSRYNDNIYYSGTKVT